MSPLWNRHGSWSTKGASLYNDVLICSTMSKNNKKPQVTKPAKAKGRNKAKRRARKESKTVMGGAPPRQAIGIFNSGKSVESYFTMQFNKGSAMARGCGPVFIASFSGAGGVQGYFTNASNKDGYVDPTEAVKLPIDTANIITAASPALAVLSFAKFRFKKLRFIYVGSTPTSLNNLYAMQYNPDGVALRSNLNTFYKVASEPISRIAPSYQTTMFDVGQYLDKDWFYTDADDTTGTFATDAGIRQSFQGFFSMILNGNAMDFEGQVDNGVLYAEWEVELSGPAPFQSNYALTSRAKAVRELLRAKPTATPEGFITIDKPKAEAKSRSNK